MRAAAAVSAWTGRVSRRLIRRPREGGERRHQQREQQQLAHQPGERGGHGAARQRGLDQRPPPRPRGAQGADGDDRARRSSARPEPGLPVASTSARSGMRGSSASASARSGSRIATGEPDLAARSGGRTRDRAPGPPPRSASGVLASGEAAPSRREPSGRRTIAEVRAVRSQGTGAPLGGDDRPAREDGDPGERAGPPEAVEEGGEAGGVPPFHQALDRRALGEQMGRGPHVARRALDRLLGGRPARLTRAIPCSSANRSISPSAAAATAITASRTRPALRPMRRVPRREATHADWKD